MFKFKYIWPYILFILSIICLVVINITGMQREVKQNLDYSQTINHAGRQRMYSQMLTKLSYMAVQNRPVFAPDTMHARLKEWNRIYHALQSEEGGLSLHKRRHPQIAEFFLTLNPVQEQLYEDFVKIAEGQANEATLSRIERNEKIFLTGMEKIVAQLQVNAQADLVTAQEKQRTMAIFSGIFLLLLILFFIYPYHRKLVRAYKKVKGQQEEIAYLNDTNKLILSGINAGIWEHDIQTNEAKWSPTFYRLLGYEPDEIPCSYNTFLNKLLHPDDKAKIIDSTLALFENKTASLQEIRVRNKNGDYKWYSSTAFAIWDDNGKPLRMAGSIIDIQENVAYREQLEDNQFLLEETNKLAKVGGWEVDIATGDIKWSKTMFTIHETTADSNMHLQERIKSYPEEYHPQINEVLAKAINHGEPFDIELEVITAKGNRKWIRSMGMPIQDEHQKTVKIRGIYQDIHERKLRELELAKTRQSLEQANEAKDKIFSIISHDMKGPLHNLRALIDMEKENIISREEFEIHMQDLKNTIYPLTEALDTILFWSRSQMQGLSVKAENFDISDTIAKTVNLYRSSCTQKNISLSHDHTTNREVYADADHAFLILRNLVNNAIKFTPEGGSIHISTDATPEHVQISIADTGIGMSPEEVAIIMQKGSYYTSRGTKGEKGTGLGLGMSFDLAVENNGHISITSEKGKGTTFTVSLPAAI